MSRRRRVANPSVMDESSGLAGWLYTDLLLGLAVVFLGTIGFTAMTKEDETATVTTTTTTSTTSTTTTTTIAPDAPPFQLSCEQFYVDNEYLRDSVSDSALNEGVTRLINEEIAKRGWTRTTARVGFVLLFGGHRDTPEDDGDQGAARAARFQERLRAQVPLLADVEMNSSGSTRKLYEKKEYRVGGPGEYMMLVFFAYQGDPAESGC